MHTDGENRTIHRVNLEEANPLNNMNALSERNTSAGPIELSPEQTANFTASLIDNVEFSNGLSRHDCIYIYTGEF